MSALALKAAEKAGEKGAESGWSSVERLIERLRGRFRDADAAAALARVQDPPANEKHLAALAAAVDDEVANDVTFAQELTALLNEAEAGGVRVKQVGQMVWEQNITASAPNALAVGAQGGDVHIHQGAESRLPPSAGLGS